MWSRLSIGTQSCPPIGVRPCRWTGSSGGFDKGAGVAVIELQAFIRARIDRLTFVEIADEVAAHFPLARRVRRSAIHAWWKRETSRQRKRGT